MPFGGMKAITYGNNLAGTINYDSQYRITGITAGAVMSLSYSAYDYNGNIQTIQDTLDSTKNKGFTYDALDRLLTASSTGIWGSLGWTYDGVGNRQTENTTAYTYVSGANKLSTVGGVSFEFDNNGNTTVFASTADLIYVSPGVYPESVVISPATTWTARRMNNSISSFEQWRRSRVMTPT